MPAEGPQWVILTPSADDVGWRQAIAAAADAADMDFVDADRLSDQDRIPGDGELWLSEDCSLPNRYGHDPLVVLMPRPETSPEAVAEARGIHPPHSVWQASLLLARAVDQGPNGALVVSGNQLNKIREQPFRLTDWLTIRPPRAGDVEAVRPAVRAALSLFSEGSPHEGLETAWSERIFQYDQQAARNWEAAGQLDITGRPRILVYGPYLALPSGLWKARVRFAVDDEAAKREFRLDWGTPSDFKSVPLTPSQSGVYEVEVEHAWHQTDMAEIRLVLMEGAFDGRLSFLGATVTYMANPQLSSL